MTLKEALRSGKKFKRLHSKRWYKPATEHLSCTIWTSVEVMAEDWITTHEPREIWLYRMKENHMWSQTDNPQNFTDVELIKVREVIED